MEGIYIENFNEKSTVKGSYTMTKIKLAFRELGSEEIGEVFRAVLTNNKYSVKGDRIPDLFSLFSATGAVGVHEFLFPSPTSVF